MEEVGILCCVGIIIIAIILIVTGGISDLLFGGPVGAHEISEEEFIDFSMAASSTCTVEGKYMGYLNLESVPYPEPITAGAVVYKDDSGKCWKKEVSNCDNYDVVMEKLDAV